MKVDNEEIKEFVKEIVKGIEDGIGKATLTDPVEVEMKITTEKEANGGLKAHIFNAGGKISKEEAHIIKFKFIP